MNLYPLQNGVLNCVKSLNLPFYLTGGTALSRGYFHHRYSDDIDLFTNNNPDFKKHAETILHNLNANNFIIDTATIIISQDYISFYVTHSNFNNVNLKVDLVNDIAPHFGTIRETSVYYQTDDWYNILINKVTALLRLEIKDYVDIWIIAKHKPFNWDDIISKAREKEVGLDPLLCVQMMKTIPFEAYTTIKWITDYTFEAFKNDLEVITMDFLKGADNSLYT
jgi:hypothetical protein